MIYIFWSASNEEEARKVIHLLIDEKLIACASIIPNIRSIYRWEGKIEESIEVKVILKTKQGHFHSISEKIRDHCSYDVPEITQIDISIVAPSYFSWLSKNVQ